MVNGKKSDLSGVDSLQGWDGSLKNVEGELEENEANLLKNKPYSRPSSRKILRIRFFAVL